MSKFNMTREEHAQAVLKAMMKFTKKTYNQKKQH